MKLVPSILIAVVLVVLVTLSSFGLHAIFGYKLGTSAPTATRSEYERGYTEGYCVGIALVSNKLVPDTCPDNLRLDHHRDLQ